MSSPAPASFRAYVATSCRPIIQELERGSFGELRHIELYQDDYQFLTDLIAPSAALRSKVKPRELLSDPRALVAMRELLQSWAKKLSCAYHGVTAQKTFRVPDGLKDRFSAEDAQFYIEYEIRALEVSVSKLILESEFAERTWREYLIYLRKNFDETLAHYSGKKLTGEKRRALYGLAKEYYGLRLDRVGVFHLVLQDAKNNHTLPVVPVGDHFNVEILIQVSPGNWHALELDKELYFYLSTGRQKLSVAYKKYRKLEKEFNIDISGIRDACDGSQIPYDGRMLSYSTVFDAYNNRLTSLLTNSSGQRPDYTAPKVLEVLDQWESTLNEANTCVARTENIIIKLEPIPFLQTPAGIASISAISVSIALIGGGIIYQAARPDIISVKNP